MFEKLRGATLDQLDKATANFTAADWQQLYDEHLGPIAIDMLHDVDLLGVDMEVDPVAIFCRLYLAEIDVQSGRRKPACTASAYCTTCRSYQLIVGRRHVSGIGVTRVRGRCQACATKQNAIVAWEVA